jgi:hypothetical protein
MLKEVSDKASIVKLVMAHILAVFLVETTSGTLSPAGTPCEHCFEAVSGAGKMRIALCAGALGLASCAVPPSDTAFVGPTGSLTHSAKCSHSPEACFKSASSNCRGPYTVVDSNSNAGGLVADILPGPVTWYNMTYICGASNGQHPTFPFRGQQYTPPTYTPPTMTNCQKHGNSVSCQTM